MRRKGYLLLSTVLFAIFVWRLLEKPAPVDIRQASHSTGTTIPYRPPLKKGSPLSEIKALSHKSCELHWRNALQGRTSPYYFRTRPDQFLSRHKCADIPEGLKRQWQSFRNHCEGMEGTRLSVSNCVLAQFHFRDEARRYYKIPEIIEEQYEERDMAMIRLFGNETLESTIDLAHRLIENYPHNDEIAEMLVRSVLIKSHSYEITLEVDELLENEPVWERSKRFLDRIHAENPSAS